MSENDDSTLPPAPPVVAVPATASRLGRLPLQAKLALGLGLAITLALFFWPRSRPERHFEDGFVMDAKGAPVALSSRLGPATLVHFWATWCPPCRKEIPSLLAFADELGPDRLTLVLIAVADESERALQFVGNPRYPVLFDPVWDAAHRFRTHQLPETHLILDGKLTDSFVGATDWHDGQSSVARRTVLDRLAARPMPSDRGQSPNRQIGDSPQSQSPVAARP